MDSVILEIIQSLIVNDNDFQLYKEFEKVSLNKLSDENLCFYRLNGIKKMNACSKNSSISGYEAEVEIYFTCLARKGATQSEFDEMLNRCFFIPVNFSGEFVAVADVSKVAWNTIHARFGAEVSIKCRMIVSGVN